MDKEELQPSKAADQKPEAAKEDRESLMALALRRQHLADMHLSKKVYIHACDCNSECPCINIVRFHASCDSTLNKSP